MRVKRFKMKAQYKTKDKSLFHKWLKEEGYSRKYLAIDLGVTKQTIDRYMNYPEQLKLHQLKAICEETNVDMNFINDLIY